MHIIMSIVLRATRCFSLSATAQRFASARKRRTEKKSGSNKKTNKLFLGVRKCLLKDNKTVYRLVCFAIEDKKATNFFVSAFRRFFNRRPPAALLNKPNSCSILCTGRWDAVWSIALIILCKLRGTARCPAHRLVQFPQINRIPVAFLTPP
jgi:hypothetical protein